MQKTYHFKEPIRHHTTYMESDTRVDRDVPDLQFRGDFEVYFRANERQMGNVMGKQSRWATQIRMVGLENRLGEESTKGRKKKRFGETPQRG